MRRHSFDRIYTNSPMFIMVMVHGRRSLSVISQRWKNAANATSGWWLFGRRSHSHCFVSKLGLRSASDVCDRLHI